MNVSLRAPESMTTKELKHELCELIARGLFRVVGIALNPCLGLFANREPNAVGEVQRPATGGATPNAEEEPQCPL